MSEAALMPDFIAKTMKKENVPPNFPQTTPPFIGVTQQPQENVSMDAVAVAQPEELKEKKTRVKKTERDVTVEDGNKVWEKIMSHTTQSREEIAQELGLIKTQVDNIYKNLKNVMKAQLEAQGHAEDKIKELTDKLFSGRGGGKKSSKPKGARAAFKLQLESLVSAYCANIPKE